MLYYIQNFNPINFSKIDSELISKYLDNYYSTNEKTDSTINIYNLLIDLFDKYNCDPDAFVSWNYYADFCTIFSDDFFGFN